MAGKSGQVKQAARGKGRTGSGKLDSKAEPQVAPARSRSRKNPFDRKQELIQATIDVLAAEGYAGTTLAEVAKAANVSTALIIVHFKSKERLLLEVLKWMGTEYFGVLYASQVGVGERPADLLWSLVESEFDPRLLTPRYLAAWKAFWAETNSRQPFNELFGAQTQHFLKLTTDLCSRIVKEGSYEGHEPRTIARLIDCSLAGLWMDLTATATPVTIKEARRIASSQLALFFPRHFTSRGPC